VSRDVLADAAVPTFLLRRYLATDAPELRDVLGIALARALELAAADTTAVGRAGWLMLLVEATIAAEDERIRPAAAALVAALQTPWPDATHIAEVSASAEACLRAAGIVEAGGLVQSAIDHLEGAIGASYRPGDGLVRERAGIRVRCDAGDHILAASALLTAFEITGRLPYSMLAEELIAVTRPTVDAPVELHCARARVLCRLAALHADPEYRGAAVIADGADYHAEASAILAAQSARARAGTPSTAAAYGLALIELLRHVR